MDEESKMHALSLENLKQENAYLKRQLAQAEARQAKLTITILAAAVLLPIIFMQ